MTRKEKIIQALQKKFPSLPDSSCSPPDFQRLWERGLLDTEDCVFSDSDSTQPPSSPDEGNTDVTKSDTRKTIEEILTSPGREHLVRLDPKLANKAIWFKKEGRNYISKAILRMMKKHMTKPYSGFRSMPLTLQQEWFRLFAVDFQWNPSITSLVEREFESQAALTFSRNLAEWKKKWISRKIKCKGMHKGVWEGYKTIWDEEEGHVNNGGSHICTHRISELEEELKRANKRIDKQGKQLEVVSIFLKTNFPKFELPEDVDDSDDDETQE